MQTADFNHQDFTHQGMAEADKSLLVKFFYKTRPDKAASDAEGRPMFKETEYIDIKINGNRSGGACRPASAGDKQRFPEHYDRFKKRVAAPMEGTPLSEWPQISRAQIEELSFVNCKTVEQLCGMSDTNLSQFMGGYALRDKAKAWLVSADKSKVIAKNLKLENQVADQQTKIDQLTQAVEVLTANQKLSLVEESVEETTQKKAKAKSKKA